MSLLPVVTARLLETRAGRGTGEAGRGPDEDRATNGRGRGEAGRECKGVRGRGRKTLGFGGYESVNRAKRN